MLNSFGAQLTHRSTADKSVVVQTEFLRCTVLSERLLRIELSPDNLFEDRPSQVFWHRDLERPSFDAQKEKSRLEIATKYLKLSCSTNDIDDLRNSINIYIKELKTTWRLGDQDDLNLLGTARTLDESDGSVNFEKGLISRAGWTIVEDTQSLVINQEGLLVPRKAADGYRDLYFFGHGHDYKKALHDFCLVAGKAPLIPRWALGNWWSRYWDYSSSEMLQLMDDFQEHQIPLSVCVVDMDWHITDTGNESSGWTGYTWNQTLFPSPEEFLKQMHRKGLRIALNLHPADGIYPHEEQYQEMCLALGVDPAEETPIQFDISDPKFTEAYFSILHHPLEEAGVDFWWIDWQQGETSKVEGLDPLWWLNHHHYYDLALRNPGPPLIFSRWGGLGNHRYPIGFSGDTIVSWESLEFQPYFTASAANVNYGWWSHDIGGHMKGIKDPELYTRWVQFGVFSPIFRLHSGNDPSQERRPWGYNPEVEQITQRYMQLRHRLIPYLYTMVYRSHNQDLPLVLPMYYYWADKDEAYKYPDQYLFGSELLVAPYLSPRDEDSQLSKKEVWLPEGIWFDFFNGAKYVGDACHTLYGTLAETLVFAKSGAIIPLAGEDTLPGTENPSAVELLLFPMGDNQFELIEDDGRGAVSKLLITQSYSHSEWQVNIHPASGDIEHLPEQRSFQLTFRGLQEDIAVSAYVNNKVVDLKTSLDEPNLSLLLSDLVLSARDRATVILKPLDGGFDIK